MDINTLRILATLASFATFVGIFVWAYWKPHASRFDEASRIPFDLE